MMIDLHSHILHGLDDGPETMDESIRMCLISYRDGVRTIVATPHTLNGEYQNDRPTILAKVKELNDAIIKFGVKSSEFGVNPSTRLPSELSPLSFELKIDPMTRQPNAPMPKLLNDPMTDFRILPGADIHFSNEILHQLDQEEVMTVGDGKRFLMLEFPLHTIPIGAEEVLFQLMARGIVPVISHPERNLEITRRPERYYEMIRMGCFGQVTAMSLTGGFGAKIKGFAEKLLKKRLIHLIASDAHSVDGRPPILSPAVKEAEKIVGREEAQKMVTEYPSAILDGRKPNVPEPLSF
jgi:protein-tyrosine phosphatase